MFEEPRIVLTKNEESRRTVLYGGTTKYDGLIGIDSAGYVRGKFATESKKMINLNHRDVSTHNDAFNEINIFLQQ